MKFPRIPILCFFVYAALPGFAAAEIAVPTCPGEIKVEQKAVGSQTDWTVFDGTTKHSFVNVAFSEGDPSQHATLVPTKDKIAKGEPVAVWEFSPSASGYWVACIYSETSAVLARKLPGNTKACRVEYDKRFSSPVATGFRCW